MVGRICETGGF